MSSRVWLLTLATRQRARTPTAALTYDADRQVTVVRNALGLVPAVESSPPTVTKKADIEKGEDQKDRWWAS
jgi:hypothetical protein